MTVKIRKENQKAGRQNREAGPPQGEPGLFLCAVDSKEGRIAGRLYYPFAGEGFCFDDLWGAFLTMKEKMGEEEGRAAPCPTNLPGGYFAGQAPAPFWEKERFDFARGRCGTAAVRVCHRRRGDWQGELWWKGGARRFCSMAELLRLLGGSLEKGR